MSPAAARRELHALGLLLALAARGAEGFRRVDRRFLDRDLQEASESQAPAEERELRQVDEDAVAADEHLVTALPGLSDPAVIKQWAGMLTVDEAKTGKLFYWLFRAEDSWEDKPLIIWLNGGPGCSSMDGLFLENGPFKLDDSLKVNMNPHSWHKVANVLYVDQPVGTGFSYTRTRAYCKNDECIASNVYTFLQNFFRLHSWLVKGAKTFPLYFTGESQAGHYIPSMAAYILDRNEEAVAKKLLTIDLQGVAIGNGWFDPPNQYDVSTFAHGVGLISQGQLETLQVKNKECLSQLDKGRYFVPTCFNLLDDIIASSGSDATGQISLYDYRLFDDPSSRTFPPGYRTVETYLNKAEVKAALHAETSPLHYAECTDPPYDALKHQDGLGVTPQIVKLLNKQVRTLFFNGVFDVICNHVGNEAALMKLDWPGQAAFQRSPRYTWLVPGLKNPGGYAKVSGPLTYLVVLDSGHMVPLSAPMAALDMIRRFVGNHGFVDRAQPIEMTVVPPDSHAGNQPTGTTPTEAPPATPKLKGAQAVDDSTVSLSFTPGSESSSQSSDLWYTVMVNPGGGVMVAEQSDDQADVLLLKDLQAGVKYSFRLVANTNAGASPPSSEASLVLGCSASEEVCEHGVCGFDDVSKSKRCFCYKGYSGSTCSTVVGTNTSGGGSGCGPHDTGRVLYSVSKECQPPSNVPCVLRFTVPLTMCTASASSPEFAYLDGPEEIRAFEKLLRRDLSHVLSSRREEIVLRSLHSINTTRSTGGGHADVAVQPGSVDTFLCTFDVMSGRGGDALDPLERVTSFRTLWADEANELRYGVVSSNFDTTRKVTIDLVSMDAPLSVGEDVKDLPLRKSLLVTAVTIMSFLVCIALLAGVSKRYYRQSSSSSTTGAFRRVRQRRTLDKPGNGSSNGSRPSGEGKGIVDDEEEEVDVEIMEIRTSTPSSLTRGPLAVGGLRMGSREVQDDGSRERLV